MGIIKDSLTFDDVSLVPQYSSVLPSETNTFTENGADKRMHLKILIDMYYSYIFKKFVKVFLPNIFHPKGNGLKEINDIYYSLVGKLKFSKSIGYEEKC